jgi:hypothetical protein
MQHREKRPLEHSFSDLTPSPSTRNEYMSVYCPRCSKQVPANALTCEHCEADFSNPDGWQATAKPGTWKPEITAPGIAIKVAGRLVLSVIGWFGFMLLALFAGFLEGGGSTWVSFGKLLGVGLIVWVLFPIFQASSHE